VSEHQVKSPQAHAASAAVTREVMPAQEFLKEDSGKEKLSGLSLQCKLSIGATDDPLEQEAETIADKVMRMPAVPLFQKTSSASLLQMERVPEGRMRQRGAGGEVIRRKCSQCEEEKLQRKSLVSYIQRKESSAGTVASEHVTEKINASRGGGRNLDGTTQSFMQNRFGADFSQVKIHTGTEAIQMNRELNAKAFTVGNDIYFNEGQYNPDSRDGKHLLAHELTHTVQQEKGVQRKIQRLPGSPAGGCGVCYGSPMLAGRVAHAFIQEEFQLLYPHVLSEHYILSILPAASGFSAGFLDLAVLESVDQIAIGEIKPANPEGLIAGEAKLALYETALSALGMRVRRMDYPPPLLSIPFPTLGRGPTCPPLQGLYVDPPVDGLYTYWCAPDFAALRPNCTCTSIERMQREREPARVRRRSGWERIRDFSRQAIETGATAASAIRAFLIANPELIDLVIGVGVAGLVATFAEDIVTLGVGIIDDLVTVPFFASMISVAMELRQAIAAGTLITTMTTR
jgi:hypothetical protein